MKRFGLIILTVWLGVSCLGAEKIGKLPEILRPDMLTMGNGNIYISEGPTIYIYHFKDLKLVKKFGKEGEGPQEFKINPFGAPMVIMPANNKLYVNSMAKLSVFTAEGQFISEQRILPDQNFYPFGDSYIGLSGERDPAGKTVMAISLCDGKLKKIKNLYLSDFEIGQSFKFEFPINPFSFGYTRDKIFVVAGKDGFAVDVFDKSGRKLYRIARDYSPLPLPGDYKAKTVQWFKKSPAWKQIYEFVKDRVVFRSHCPPIFDMTNDNERLYVLTYVEKDGKRECIVMDLKGKEIKRVFLPVPTAYGFEYLPRYTFHRGSFYILVENEDEEIFELLRTKLD